MTVCQLIYLSRATEKLSLRDTMDLVEQASVKNERAEITGLLCYGGGFFLQVLEGDGDQISQTFCRIARDPRHRDVRLIDFSVVQTRRFDDWSLHLINLDDPNRPEAMHRPPRFQRDRTHPFFSTDPQVAFWMLYDLKTRELEKPKAPA